MDDPVNDLESGVGPAFIWQGAKGSVAPAADTGTVPKLSGGDFSEVREAGDRPTAPARTGGVTN